MGQKSGLLKYEKHGLREATPLCGGRLNTTASAPRAFIPVPGQVLAYGVQEPEVSLSHVKINTFANTDFQ